MAWLSLGAGITAIPTDFALEVAKNNIEGVEPAIILGLSKSLGPDKTRTVWDLATDVTYLPADTQLFLSSTDAADTAVLVLVLGLDDTYTPVMRVVTANGLTQVALSGLMFRVNTAIVIGGTTPLGDLYIAETDTLTGGVPDTPSKIQSAILLTGLDGSTEFASYNSTHNGFFTVPAGKTFFGVAGAGAIAKDESSDDFGGRIKLFGSNVWLNRNPLPFYQGVAQFPFDTRTPAPEKAELQFRASALNPNTLLQFQIQGWLVDNTKITPALLKLLGLSVTMADM